MMLTAILLIVLSLQGTAWHSGNWIEGVSVTEAKNQQKIFCLPENHPLKADEDSLRHSTRDFCTREKGQAVYDRWIGKFDSKFEYGSISEREKEKYIQFLFNFRELFGRDPT